MYDLWGIKIGNEPLHEGYSSARPEYQMSWNQNSPMQTSNITVYKLNQALQILETLNFGTSTSGPEVKVGGPWLNLHHWLHVYSQAVNSKIQQLQKSKK